MTAPLTCSGIPGIGDVAWGDHVCHFYGTSNELSETLVPYFKAGIANNEQCVWVTSDSLRASDARSALGSVVPNLAELEERGQVILVESEHWYSCLAAGGAEAIIQSWLHHEELALQKGYTGLRVTGSANGVPKETAWPMLVAYETMVNAIIKGRRVVALCSYCLGRYTCQELLDVIALHQYGVTKRTDGWGIVESGWMRGAREELHRLSQATEFRDQFLGVVTHDLRNPLNSIMLATHSLLHSEHELRPEDRQKLYSRIMRSAQRMANLIADLADLTRARSGHHLPIRPAPADINAICKMVCEELDLIHPGRSVKLDLHAAGQGVWDRARLAQALSNIVGNALQYSPANSSVTVRTYDGPPRVIRVNEHALVPLEHESLYIQVHNWGEPIDPELLPHLFEPFHRGSQTATSMGLGLGLFIAERIIASHGGSIEVQSTRDQGTTFTIHLPRQLSESGLCVN